MCSLKRRLKLKHLLQILFLSATMLMFSCEDVENGIDGEDGLNLLVLVEDEPSGSNCVNGGKKVSFGYDSNESGVLEPTEVSTSTFICDGEDGDDGTTNGAGEGGEGVTIPIGSNGGVGGDGGSPGEVADHGIAAVAAGGYDTREASLGGGGGADGAAIRRTAGLTLTITNNGTITGDQTATGVA